MKHLRAFLALLILCLFTNGLKSQNEIPKGSYYFTESVMSLVSDQTEYNISPANLNSILTAHGVISPDKAKESLNPEIEKGLKIEVIEIDFQNEIVFYRYWTFKDGAPGKSKYNGDKIFSLPLKDFVQLTAPLYNWHKGFSVGTYTVPFRLRDAGGDRFDFESSLSLQANFIWGLGSTKKEESILDVSLGIGLSSVNINFQNSNVLDTALNRTAAAFTTSIGIVYKPTKFVNIGVFTGIDNLGLSDKSVDWYYDNKAWIGLGINISFNEVKSGVRADPGKQ